ncbi:mannose-ethanolamine phosphotransferase gpi13 [Trapelia coarctata]|nr:mannose-ethanolamine phosphotransferase gpi13 [Trapelia coarctata]
MSNKESEYSIIAGQFAAARAEQEKNTKAGDLEDAAPSDQSSDEQSRIAAIRFKSLHLLVVTFFLWILLLHTVGIYFFTKGFLLTRLVLDHKSECLSPPLNTTHSSSYKEGCWHPKQFNRAIVIIIDALRYDFTVPYRGEAQAYHNTLKVLHETAVETPKNAFLLPFIADPPTTTLQRLKGLTTGTLPTFIDAGSNFAGTAIEEDNLVAQLREANRTLVHLGDDTWHSLFPGYFDANLTHAYDSFNVWDLHTVDDGVTKHLLPLMGHEYSSQWDVLFGHYLGVDHAGHRYGPDHPAMTAKLQQMDEVLRQIIGLLDQQTLLVVMGDHGMDGKGDHGGESDDEVEAALWMYSKQGIFGRSEPAFALPPATAKVRPVAQIDLVPTLSLLLGMPIPFNNLGAPIQEAFIGPDGWQWRNLATVNALTGAQIHKYQHEYALARGLEELSASLPDMLWDKAHNLWLKLSLSPKFDPGIPNHTVKAFSEYQIETLRICRSLWARFDVPRMLLGIGVLVLALVTLLSFAISSPSDKAAAVPGLLRYIGTGSLTGGCLGRIASSFVVGLPALDSPLIGTALGGLCGYVLGFYRVPMKPSLPLPDSLWGWLAFVFTVSQSIGFASNSYTIWEDEILLVFLSSFAILAVFSSTRQVNITDRVLGIYHSVLFLLLTRTASLSRLCREEQMPYCRSTYYASANSSTSATWQLLIPYVLAVALPTIIKSYYQGTRSYEGAAVFWLGFALRMGLLGSALYWTLEAADDGDWFSTTSFDITTLRVILAQVILGVGFAAGTTTFVWAVPCIRVETTQGPDNSPKENAVPKAKSITILGYANVHGSRYFLLLSGWLLGVILVQKPMGGGVIGMLACQILSLLEIIDTNGISDSVIGPIVLGLLGNFHFFKTGHQATPASIQWNAAFIALKTIRYPWSPMLVALNTFGSQILTAIAVPLIVLWKQPPKKPRLLGSVAKAMAVHLSYYAVINLATTMWAGWLRRHLMLYRIFSPRFMTGAVVLLVVDLVGALVAIGGFRWNLLGVNEVFGWS